MYVCTGKDRNNSNFSRKNIIAIWNNNLPYFPSVYWESCLFLVDSTFTIMFESIKIMGFLSSW